MYVILKAPLKAGGLLLPAGMFTPARPLWLIHTARERDREQHREWNLHNRKQWTLVPLTVSDQCEHFYVILYFPSGPCTSSIPVVCEYTINHCVTITSWQNVLCYWQIRARTPFLWLISSHKLWCEQTMSWCMKWINEFSVNNINTEHELKIVKSLLTNMVLLFTIPGIMIHHWVQ